MKKVSVFFLSFGISLLIFNHFFFKTQRLENDKKLPKINDCFIFQLKSKNPFNVYKPDTIRILDIKGDYLKYQKNNWFISSERIDVISDYLVKTDSCNCFKQ